MKCPQKFTSYIPILRRLQENALLSNRSELRKGKTQDNNKNQDNNLQQAQTAKVQIGAGEWRSPEVMSSRST